MVTSLANDAWPYRPESAGSGHRAGGRESGVCSADRRIRGARGACICGYRSAFQYFPTTGGLLPPVRRARSTEARDSTYPPSSVGAPPPPVCYVTSPFQALITALAAHAGKAISYP